MRVLTYYVKSKKIEAEHGGMVETYGLVCYYGKLRIALINDVATDKTLVCQMADLFTYIQCTPWRCKAIARYLLAVDSRFWHYVASV